MATKRKRLISLDGGGGWIDYIATTSDVALGHPVTNNNDVTRELNIPG